MANNITYSDFNTGFDVNPITGDLSILTNGDAVKQSIINLILTNFYERPMKYNFGSNVLGSLFELSTPATQQILEQNIRQAINNYEPRANIISVIVQPYIDENAVAITIVFTTINSNIAQTVTVTLDRVH
jgi:phage baseplate assembly protein W